MQPYAKILMISMILSCILASGPLSPLSLGLDLETGAACRWNRLVAHDGLRELRRGTTAATALSTGATRHRWRRRQRGREEIVKLCDVDLDVAKVRPMCTGDPHVHGISGKAFEGTAAPVQKSAATFRVRLKRADTVQPRTARVGHPHAGRDHLGHERLLTREPPLLVQTPIEGCIVDDGLDRVRGPVHVEAFIGCLVQEPDAMRSFGGVPLAVDVLFLRQNCTMRMGRLENELIEVLLVGFGLAALGCRLKLAADFGILGDQNGRPCNGPRSVKQRNDIAKAAVDLDHLPPVEEDSPPSGPPRKVAEVFSLGNVSLDTIQVAKHLNTKLESWELIALFDDDHWFLQYAAVSKKSSEVASLATAETLAFAGC